MPDNGGHSSGTRSATDMPGMASIASIPARFEVVFVCEDRGFCVDGDSEFTSTAGLLSLRSFTSWLLGWQNGFRSILCVCVSCLQVHIQMRLETGKVTHNVEKVVLGKHEELTEGF